MTVNRQQFYNNLRLKICILTEQKLSNDIFQDHPELNSLFTQFINNKDIKAHHILVLLLRLRQLCCHPYLMKNVCILLIKFI